MVVLQKMIAEKERSLQSSPPGKIHIVKANARVQYYMRTDPKDRSGTYISKKNVETIRLLLQKSYDQKALLLARQELQNIETFLNQSNDSNKAIQEIYSCNPLEVKSFLTPADCSDADFIEYWKNIPFDGNPWSIPATEYKTENGELVRSKSELTIANALYKAGIPYKYECPLVLADGITVYPDFTILIISSRSQVYWEHRGMMEDHEYAKNAVKKLKEYSRNGIITGKNLIITEESSTYPLGTDEINAVVKMLLNA